MDALQNQIDKIKYQLKTIGVTIDNKQYPIESLVIQLDWDENDLTLANDIFEKYDKMLEAYEDVNWTEFEFNFRDQFGIGYQTVKSIILAFYRNLQWRDVCKGYAEEHDVTEFREILHPINNEDA